MVILLILCRFRFKRSNDYAMSVTRRVCFIGRATVTARNGYVKGGKKQPRIKQVLIKLPVPFVQNPRSAQSKPCGVVQGRAVNDF